MTRPHATQPGIAADARRLLAGLPEGATLGPWYASDILDTGGMRPGWGVVTDDNSMLVGARVHRADAALIAASPQLRDALTAALDREAELLTLLTEAAGIIAEHAPGYTVWLREASVATRTPHLGDSDAE